MSSRPKAPVRTPRPNVARINSTKNSKASAAAWKPSTTASTNPAAKGPPTCPNTSCTDPCLEQHSGQTVCVSCGTVVSDANIVSEVQFGETSGGAAIVQGAFVGENEGHARSNIPGGNRLGLNSDSREKSDADGKRKIGEIGAALAVPQTTQNAAFNIWRLCTAANFIQGRRINQVAAVCLYIACRKLEKENKWMLIDFSDLIQVNVFALGHVFTSMLKNLGSIGGVPNIIIENLVYRFVEKLDFGDVKVKVAGDAVRLVQRMKKDWMAIGRRPAGVCGASVILAARMNNFRRSVREVVYIAKVTDLTIHKRLDEFKVTASSDLTIDQFRVMELEREHDPPAFYEDRRKNKRRKLSTQAAGETEEGEGTEGGSNVGSRASSAAPQEQPRGRIDQDGFAIPDQPSHNPLIDPELLAASNDALSEISDTASVTSQSPPKRKRGRPRKDSAAAQLPALSRKDIEDQEALEREITEMVNDPTAKRHAANATSAGNDNSQASNLTSSTSNAINSTPSTINSSTSIHNEEAYARSLAIATQVSSQHKPVSAIPDTEIIPEDEFAGDLDVENCLLTEPEREIKERIWVHENQDYLRTQQARLLKKQMEEKNGSSRVIRRRRRVHKGQIGAEGEHTSGASTPQEAARMMLTRRGFSTRINYANIERMISKERKTKFRRGSAASGENASDLGSEVATEAGSEAASPPAALSPDDDGGEEEEAEGLESAVGEAINDAVDAAEDGLFLR